MYRQAVEFCPKCGSSQRANRSLGLKKSLGAQGKEYLLFYFFHCDTCGTFIRSEPLTHAGSSVTSQANDVMLHNAETELRWARFSHRSGPSQSYADQVIRVYSFLSTQKLLRYFNSLNDRSSHA